MKPFLISLTLLLFILILIGVEAVRAETRVEHGSITYTAVTFDTKNKLRQQTRLLKQVPYDQCDVMATDLEQVLRTKEESSATAVNRNNWAPISEAICSRSFKLIPSDTFTLASFCELTFDPIGGTILEQEQVACTP